MQYLLVKEFIENSPEIETGRIKAKRVIVGRTDTKNTFPRFLILFRESSFEHMKFYNLISICKDKSVSYKKTPFFEMIIPLGIVHTSHSKTFPSNHVVGLKRGRSLSVCDHGRVEVRGQTLASVPSESDMVPGGSEDREVHPPHCCTFDHINLHECCILFTAFRRNLNG